MESYKTAYTIHDDGGESWTHYWLFERDGEDDIDAFASDCLDDVVDFHAYSQGGGIPGQAFHHRPNIYFSGQHSGGYDLAVVIIAQHGGLDI